MSDPSDSKKNITPGVNKQTRRFAPVKRGGRTARSSTVAVKVETVENPSESTSATPPKSIGTMRPETPDEGRLPSINDGQKTRGGAAKMKFKPTVPTKRNKKEVSASAIDDALSGGRGDRGRGRGRGGRGGRGRGRGRGDGLIYVEESSASGIFSLGPSAAQRGRPNYGSGGGFATYGGDVPSRAEGDSTHSDMVQMFTETYDKDTPVTFRHISYRDGDVDPVTLAQKVGKIPWMRTTKEEKKEEAAVVKPETIDDGDMMETDEKPEPKPETREATPEPPILMDADSPAQNILALDHNQRAVCVAEEELLYFQLPTIVPKFEAVKTETMMKDEPLDEDGVKETDEKQKTLPNAAQKATIEEAMATLKLEDMPEGQVGKLVVYKSGKMKMKFGNLLLDVIQGMHSSFLENVMVVDHESEDTKKVIELGHVVEKFVCIPNMDALLSEEEKALV